MSAISRLVLKFVICIFLSSNVQANVSNRPPGAEDTPYGPGEVKKFNIKIQVLRDPPPIKNLDPNYKIAITPYKKYLVDTDKQINSIRKIFNNTFHNTEYQVQLDFVYKTVNQSTPINYQIYLNEINVPNDQYIDYGAFQTSSFRELNRYKLPRTLSLYFPNIVVKNLGGIALISQLGEQKSDGVKINKSKYIRAIQSGNLFAIIHGGMPNYVATHELGHLLGLSHGNVFDKDIENEAGNSVSTSNYIERGFLKIYGRGFSPNRSDANVEDKYGTVMRYASTENVVYKLSNTTNACKVPGLGSGPCGIVDRMDAARALTETSLRWLHTP